MRATQKPAAIRPSSIAAAPDFVLQKLSKFRTHNTPPTQTPGSGVCTHVRAPAIKSGLIRIWPEIELHLMVSGVLGMMNCYFALRDLPARSASRSIRLAGVWAGCWQMGAQSLIHFNFFFSSALTRLRASLICSMAWCHRYPQSSCAPSCRSQGVFCSQETSQFCLPCEAFLTFLLVWCF